MVLTRGETYPIDMSNPNLQVWVVGAELEPEVLSAGASSFIVVDFFDFESQATPLLPGVSPAFDFATTFKVWTRAHADAHCKHGVLTPFSLQGHWAAICRYRKMG